MLNEIPNYHEHSLLLLFIVYAFLYYTMFVIFEHNDILILITHVYYYYKHGSVGRVCFCMCVTSYCLLYELWVAFWIRITNFFSHTSYELRFVARVKSYFFHVIYELLFIARVKSVFFHTSYELLFTERVTFLKVFCFIYHWSLFNMKNVLEIWFAANSDDLWEETYSQFANISKTLLMIR